MQETGVDADRPCVGRIEAEQHQIPAKHQQQGQHQDGNHQGLLKVCSRDSQNIAKENVGEVDVAARFRHEHQTQREESREDQADHGVFLDP